MSDYYDLDFDDIEPSSDYSWRVSLERVTIPTKWEMFTDEGNRAISLAVKEFITHDLHREEDPSHRAIAKGLVESLRSLDKYSEVTDTEPRDHLLNFLSDWLVETYGEGMKRRVMRAIFKVRKESDTLAWSIAMFAS